MRKRSEANGVSTAHIGEMLVDTPNDPINEMAVLGAMCADDFVRADLVKRLQPSLFYAAEHRAIFEALKELDRQKLAFDPAVLHRMHGEVDIYRVEQLVSARPTVPENLDHHIETLQWDAQRAKAARGPLHSFLEAFQDPRTSPAMLRALSKGLAESFEGGAASADPFGFRSALDIATPKEPVPMVVPQFGIGVGRPALLSAYAGTGKTMYVIELLLSIAANRKTAWGGALKLAANGPTRLLDYELGDLDTDDRAQRLAHGMKIDLASLHEGDRFRISNFPRLYLSDDSAEVEEALVRVLQGVVLCVIDNFTSATSKDRKHGANDTGSRSYLDVLTRVSLRTHCAFVVLTHDGKDEKRGALRRMRDSSALADAANSVISMQANTVGEIVVTHAKHGNTKKGEPVVIKLVDTGTREIVFGAKKYEKTGLAVLQVEGASAAGDESGEPSDRAVDAAKKAIIAKLVMTKPAPGVRELLRLVKGHATEAKKQALAELRESGRITEGKGPRGQKPLTLADVADEEGDNQGAEQPF